MLVKKSLFAVPRNTWRAFRAYPLPSLGGLAGAGLLFDWLGHLQTGGGVMSWLFGDDWFSRFHGSGYYPITGLILVIGCFLYIGYRTTRDEKKFAERETMVRNAAIAEAMVPVSRMLSIFDARQSQLAADLQMHLDIVDTAANASVRMTLLADAWNDMRAMDDCIQQAEQAQKEIVQDVGTAYIMTIRRCFDPLSAASKYSDRLAAALELRDPLKATVELRPETKSMPQGSTQETGIDWAENELFRRDMRANLEALRSNAALLRGELMRQEHIAKHERETIWNRFKAKT